MNSDKCYRVFVANDDALQLTNFAQHNKVVVEFGGPPKRVVVFPGFERPGTVTQWSVAYITGNWVSITNLYDQWEKYIRDTTPNDILERINPGMRIAPLSLRG